MALIVDKQQPEHKHLCRICKKSFGCGQALGGHMRAHGISDEISSMDDDDDEDHTSYDWAANTSKRMYALRTNTKILKMYRVCENCGINFSSWKTFLEHGKCTLDKADSDPRDLFHGSYLEEGLSRGEHEHNWLKRKRSYRAKVGKISNFNCPSSEEEDLADCLMMLSNGLVEPFSIAEAEQSRASPEKEEGTKNHLNFYNQSYKRLTLYEKEKFVSPKGLFECKACKKLFSSHQALGGHRASHKKVKGCFAAKLDHNNDNEANQAHGIEMQEELYHTRFQYEHNGSSPKKKAKVHECSICYRVFSSGQALGGHKRCHWIKSKSSGDHISHSTFELDKNQFYVQNEVNAKNISKDSKTLDLTLDLGFHTQYAKPQNNQVSQEILLLPWIEGEDCEKDKTSITKEKTENLTEDDRETKSKFAKLTRLKEMNTSDSSSLWLQVGLGSTSSQAGSDC